MPIALKLYAALGMLWSLVQVALLIAEGFQNGLTFWWWEIAFSAAMFFVWWRCYSLQRIAVLLGCAYCAMATVWEYQYGSLDGTYFWGVTTLILTAITCMTWPQLKKGI